MQLRWFATEEKKLHVDVAHHARPLALLFFSFALSGVFFSAHVGPLTTCCCSLCPRTGRPSNREKQGREEEEWGSCVQLQQVGKKRNVRSINQCQLYRWQRKIRRARRSDDASFYELLLLMCSRAHTSHTSYTHAHDTDPWIYFPIGRFYLGLMLGFFFWRG